MTYSIPPRALAVLRAVAEEETAAGNPITVEALVGQSRAKRVVRPRHEVWRRLYDEHFREDGSRVYSLPRLGQIMDRDHTSILFGVNKARALRNSQAVDLSGGDEYRGR